LALEIFVAESGSKNYYLGWITENFLPGKRATLASQLLENSQKKNPCYFMSDDRKILQQPETFIGKTQELFQILSGVESIIPIICYLYYFSLVFTN
jgi:hypothetical protein